MYLVFFAITSSYAFFAAESALILFDSLGDIFCRWEEALYNSPKNCVLVHRQIQEQSVPFVYVCKVLHAI